MLNRKRGAKRAAETRAKTKLASTSVLANSQSGNSLNPYTPPSTATAVSIIQAEQPIPTTATPVKLNITTVGHTERNIRSLVTVQMNFGLPVISGIVVL